MFLVSVRHEIANLPKMPYLDEGNGKADISPDSCMNSYVEIFRIFSSIEFYDSMPSFIQRRR